MKFTGKRPFKQKTDPVQGKKPGRKKKLLLGLAALCVALPTVFALAANLSIILYAKKYVVTDVEKLPKSAAVIVPGAKTYDGYLSLVLRDRVDGGILLMRQGIAPAILLSGDHGSRNYDEVNNMKNYVLKNAPEIKREVIFLDHAGFNTYDTFARAKQIFCVDSAVIVTQDFHIYRSVFLARTKGIDASGYALSENIYSKRTRLSWQIREFLARTKAAADVILNRKPHFGGSQIPVSGSALPSWD